VKIVNEAVDEVCRDKSKENEMLKKTRYLWLKNPEKLTKKQQRKLESLKQRKQRGRSFCFCVPLLLTENEKGYVIGCFSSEILFKNNFTF